MQLEHTNKNLWNKNIMKQAEKLLYEGCKLKVEGWRLKNEGYNGVLTTDGLTDRHLLPKCKRAQNFDFQVLSIGKTKVFR